jgi:hypothetical protein
MKLEHRNKKEDTLAMGLFALSVILGVIVLLKAGQFLITTAQAQRLASGMTSQQADDPNEIEKHLASDKELAKQLKEKNLFAPPGPKQHPIKQVQGIMGKEALINGKWYKAGDKVKDAEIIAIEPTLIRVKWDGKEKTFAPIAAASSRTTTPVKKKVAKKKQTTVQVTSEEVEQEQETAAEENPLGWLGIDLGGYKERALKLWNRLNDQQKGWVRQKWEELPQEQKDQIRQQWDNAPDEMKQQWFDHMEQHFDEVINSIQA